MGKHIETHKEISIYCPNNNCKTLIIKEALFTADTHFKIKCHCCGEFVYVNIKVQGFLQVL